MGDSEESGVREDMANSIILKLQKLALKEESSILTILNYALFTSKKLRLEHTTDWINNEIYGYSNVIVPEYRIVRGKVKNFTDHGLQNVVFVDPKLEEIFSTIPLGYPISQIQNLLERTEGNTLVLEHDRAFVQKFWLDRDTRNVRPSIEINISQIAAIPSQLRAVVLSWACDLEKNDILGNNEDFTKEEIEKVTDAQEIIVNKEAFGQYITGLLKEDS
jgi:hypothetical protein